MNKSVVITDFGFPDLEQEKKILGEIDCKVIAGSCKNDEEVLVLSKDADALMVQWAPVTKKVMDGLRRCKIIVRYGIGVDNVDLNAAKERGIPVCNVPDYCIQEVADHSVALAVALGRQLTITEKRLQTGIWKITPSQPMPAFREMLFATVGYGRIASEVLKRASAFGFRTAAFDPYLNQELISRDNVMPLSLPRLLESADILSLHLPLNDATYHLINEEALGMMKQGALIINTSRGGLIDTEALANALSKGRIAGAGLDVFEKEPIPMTHPLLQCENVILTSHTAWYSESSVPALQRKAAEEVVRGLTGQPLKNRVA